MSAATARWARLSAVIGAVARQALADRGLERVALLDDGSPEAALAARLLAPALGEAALVAVAATPAEVESVLRAVGQPVAGEAAAEEVRRLKARLLAGALAAHPANKTALLLGAALPPEPLLPLADLYASQVAELQGECSLPPEARELAEAAGGVAVLDAALQRYLEARDAAALAGLRGGVGTHLRDCLARGRAERLAPRLVPKLGYRTLGVDLFE